MSWCETEMQKYMPLVKQNVMKFEVFILGGQRIDQKRRDGGEGVERGLRWKQREDRDREKRHRVNNLKRRIRNINTCLCLLFLKALRFS